MKLEYEGGTEKIYGEMKDKNEIVKEVKKYLSKKADNSVIDLNGFIEENCHSDYKHSAFIRDVASKLERTGKYKIQEVTGRFLIKPVPLDDRVYNKVKWILPILSFLLSLTALLVAFFKK